MTRRLYDHVWESWCADTAVLADGLPAALRTGGPAPQKLGQILERWLLLLKVRFVAIADQDTAKTCPVVCRRGPGVSLAVRTLHALLRQTQHMVLWRPCGHTNTALYMPMAFWLSKSMACHIPFRGWW